MKQLPILCGTCRKYTIKKDDEGNITGYSCFGSSMQRAGKEKECTSYSHDKLQTLLIEEAITKAFENLPDVDLISIKEKVEL